MSMNLHPKADTKNIVQQSVNGELLLYNLTSDKAYCLNQTSADIYNLCDGTNEIDSIAGKTKLPKEIIQLAISDLSKQNLLTERLELQTSRRSLLRNAALTAVALPMISTLIAPTAAHAASFACTGTAPGGTVIGSFPSDTTQGTTVCADPARKVCQSCDYNRASSTCDNANCATVTCVCAATPGGVRRV